MYLRLFVLIACIFLYGCAGKVHSIDTSRLEKARISLAKVNLSGLASTLTPARAKIASIDTKTQDAELSTAFADMLSACQSVLSGFESNADRLKKWKVAIATTGALVGSVAIPALTTASAAGNAVWISGLGGIAGVSNIAQQTMETEGLTSSSMLTIRKQIITDWKLAMNDYFDPDIDYPKRRLAIQKGIAACTMYAATVNTNVTTGAAGGQ